MPGVIKASFYDDKKVKLEIENKSAELNCKDENKQLFSSVAPMAI